MKEKFYCRVYGCKSLSSYSTNKGRSKLYFSEHSKNGVKYKRSICGEILADSANNAIKDLSNNKCRSCNIKKIMETDHRQQRQKIIEKI